MTEPIKTPIRLFWPLLALAASCLVLGNAEATLLFSEGFNYTAGSTLGGKVNPSTGNAWSSGNNGMFMTGGNLTYPPLQDLGGNNLMVAWGGSAGSIATTYANVTSGTLFYSFLLDCTNAASSSLYLTSLNPGTTTPGGSTDALSVYTKSATGGFQLAIRTPGQNATYATNVLSLNTTYFIVVGYTFGATPTATLYLSATPGGSQPAADVTLTANGTVTSIDDVGFKVQGTGNTGNFLFDDLYIGTTWADVTPVPEPATFSLAGLAFLGWALRRRMRE